MAPLTPEQRSEVFFSNIADSDCAVIAIQAVTGLRRVEAERLARKHGYDNGITAGTPRSGIHAAIREAGFNLREVRFDRSDTPATFSLRHEDGRFIIHVEAHVMALVEGDLHNSRGFWHERIEEIQEVTC